MLGQAFFFCLGSAQSWMAQRLSKGLQDWVSLLSEVLGMR